MSDESKVRDAADAVKGIVEAVPVYQDAIQPAAKEIGKGLETVAKTIHIALAPVAGLVWGFERIKDFVHTRVAEKLKDVPPERITSPSPSVAGPALEALRYAGHDPDLREMYANLLAASMDAATAQNAHPAFVEIIKQLSPDEAKLLRLFVRRRPLPVVDVNAADLDDSGSVPILARFSLLGYDAACQHPQMAPNYLTNLCRLGLTEIPAFGSYTHKKVYEPLRNHPTVQSLKAHIEGSLKKKMEIVERHLAITPLGQQFIQACVDKPPAIIVTFDPPGSH